MAFHDFEQLKLDNPIETVAATLGIELKKRGNQLRGSCPSGEGGERAFVITPSKGVFYSFPKSTGGDVIDLVCFMRNSYAEKPYTKKQLQDAAGFLAGDSSPEKKTNTGSKPKRQESSEGFRALEYLEPTHVAVEALGMDADDAAKIGCGYAPRGVLRGTVAIPVRMSDGTLIGYIGVTDAKLPGQWHM